MISNIEEAIWQKCYSLTISSLLLIVTYGDSWRLVSRHWLTPWTISDAKIEVNVT